MNAKKRLGIFLSSLGIFLVINSEVQITAAVIGVTPDYSLSLILGLLFFIVGLMLAAQHGQLEKKVRHRPHVRPQKTEAERYYEKRTEEITKNAQDNWISQWELKGLVKELQKKGFHIRGPEREWGGHSKKGPYEKHMKISGYNKNHVYLRKHLFITRDPNDARLYRLGWPTEKKKSKIYYAKHPRS